MFEAARSKIKWANKHITDLNDALKAFIQTDFCDFAVEHNPQTGDYVLAITHKLSLPCEIGLMVGDALHNLRSALDIAYVEAVMLAGCTPSDRTQLRFFNTRDELISTLGKGILQTAPDIVDVIADLVKPYATGNNPLFALHDLNISDKHIRILPVVSVGHVVIDHVDLISESGAPIGVIQGCTATIREGGKLCIYGQSGPYAKFHAQGRIEPSFVVHFGKVGNVLEGKPLVPTLNQLSKVVSGVVEIFEKAIQTRNALTGADDGAMACD